MLLLSHNIAGSRTTVEEGIWWRGLFPLYYCLCRPMTSPFLDFDFLMPTRRHMVRVCQASHGAPWHNKADSRRQIFVHHIRNVLKLTIFVSETIEKEEEERTKQNNSNQDTL